MRVLVTGGGGFLGSHVVRELLAGGHEVRSLSRAEYPALAKLGVRTFQVDLAAGGPILEQALEGVQGVVHCAAKAGLAGPRESYLQANFVGTKNLLAASQRAGVTRFVHTSSPSVCFAGTDHVQAGADLPLSTQFLSAYPESKALAEKAVLAAHDPSGMATTALRPHLIFGPGDPHLIPRLIERAKKRKLIRVGSGKNEVSLTFVENAAHAHVLALQTLDENSPAGGKGYFVGQAEPVLLWPWIDELLLNLDLPPIKRHMPAKLAYAIGALCEGLFRILRKKGDPPMTRFLAAQLSTSHSYDLGPIQRDFAYRELVPLAEATERTVTALRIGMGLQPGPRAR